jgi:hypothetical protein
LQVVVAVAMEQLIVILLEVVVLEVIEQHQV